MYEYMTRPIAVGVSRPIFRCGINLIRADMMVLCSCASIRCGKTQLCIAAMAVMRPELVIKSITAVVVVGDFAVAVCAWPVFVR